MYNSFFADGRHGSVVIHSDAKLYAGLFDGNETAILTPNPSRNAYVHLIRVELKVNGQTISTDDALLLEQESQSPITNAKKAEVLIFDLAA